MAGGCMRLHLEGLMGQRCRAGAEAGPRRGPIRLPARRPSDRAGSCSLRRVDGWRTRGSGGVHVAKKDDGRLARPGRS